MQYHEKTFMKETRRLSLLWITTFFLSTSISGQITFVNPPSDTSATCTTFVAFPQDPQVQDDCEGNIFVFFSDFSNRATNTDTCSFYEYTITRTFTATNDCQDTTRYTQTISIIDTIAPIFTPPAAVTINCADLNNLEIAGRVEQFADECGGPILSTYEDENVPAICGSTITRIWTVSDVCGNSSTGTQAITIEDTIPPYFVQSPRDVSISCSTTENPFPEFNKWVRNMGLGTFQDACNDVNLFFAAVPGSYDVHDVSTFPGEHPGSFNAPECMTLAGVVQFEEVDFVIVDECGNASVESAIFSFVDDVFPILGDCDPDITVNLDGSSCTESLTFNVPDASDACAMEDLEVKIFDIQTLEYDTLGDSTLLVSDINFRLSEYGPEILLADEQYFTISMSNIDANDSSEYFNIFDENNNNIGQTPILSSECGDTIFQLGPFPVDTVKKWVADGEIIFRFIANVDTLDLRKSINQICENASIEIYQNFIVERMVDRVQLFFELDQEPQIPVDGISVIADVGAGLHFAKFIARDCAGNTTSCAQRVTVFDNTAPELNCAANMEVNASENGCEVPVLIGDIAMINNPCGEDFQLNIAIEGAMNTSVTGMFESLKDSFLLYPIGMSTIRVTASDFSNNQSQCSFTVEVEDNIFPIADCDNIEVPAVAVNLETFQVSPFQLAGNSTDNCGIRNIVIQDNRFSCFDLGQIITKTVLVIDNSGNTSTCEGTFSISPAIVPITYTAGICPEDSLKFFLNIPKRPEFVYDWDGPLGFSSVLAEPFIPEVQVVHEGNYTVRISNTQTGCESFGSVEVFIDDVKRPELTTDEIGCTAIPHRLTSTVIEGDVVYNWYQYIDNARSLLAVTVDPFTDLDLEPGDYIFGLTVSNSQCESFGSNRVPVEIRGQPEGAICTKLIEGCIGSPLELCAKDPDDGFAIRWFGPNDFVSSEVKPIVTDSFTSEFSGVYKLVIEDNLCITDTLTTTVTSNSTPPVPEIIGTLRYCAGDTIEFASSEVKSGYIYVWESPSGTIRNNQPVLRIPNAGSHFTGSWNLRIESGPCTSAPSQLVLVDVEPKINFRINPVATQCEGAQIILDSNAPLDSEITWTGPNNFVSSEISPMVDVVEGFYQASITTKNGCSYTDEIFINTVIIPQIIGVEVSEEGPCINPESTLVIIPKFSMAADVQFEWVGPKVTSESSSLSIENYSFGDNGIYTVKVLNGDCESEVFDFILNFIISPIKPTVNADPLACLGDPLTITTNKYGSGAIYTWTTPSGIVETTENQLFFESVSTAISGSYGVQVTIGECTSPASDIVNIFVNDNVMVPSISASGEECVENEYHLFTDFSDLLEIEWELPSGELVTADTLSLLLEESDAGSYRARTYSNDCPSEWSSIFSIDVLDPRKNVSLVTDFIFSCNNDDADLEFCVESSSPTSGIVFQWFLGQQLIGETSDLCFRVQDLSVFSFGQNEISLQFVYNGCLLPFEDPLFLEIENVRDISASAGGDQLFCVGDALLMNADDVNTSELSGFWSVDVGLQVDDIRDPMAEITVLVDVDSIFAVWNVEHFECGVVYRDSVVLKQKVKPQPVSDTLEVDEIRYTFEPLLNDVLIPGNTYQITDVSNPRWGSATISGTSITYEADPKFIGGPVAFSYTVCDNQCSDLCNEGEILILYNTGSCKGNNVLTPNNDGANDRFIIPCIEDEVLPNNSLVIINEVGNTIFEASPYTNTWDGTFNGQILPEGTYYYIFRKDASASVVQGFISIEH